MKTKLTRDELIRVNNIKDLLKQIKKYSDAGSTAKTIVEINASMNTIYYLLNIIKSKMKDLEGE